MPTARFALFDGAGPLTITNGTTATRSLDLDFLTIVWGRVTDISVTLGGLSHTFPDDLDFLLLGPRGTNLEFWSDAGAGGDIVNRNYTITDSAAALLPDTPGPSIASGAYKPTDYSPDSGETSANWNLAPIPRITINHPASTDMATFASAFGGVWVDNSTWSLHVTDD